MGSDTEITNDKNENDSDRKDDNTKQQGGLYQIFHRLKSDEAFRQQIVHTLILGWSFIGLGWSAGMNGPVFPDLRQIIQEDLAKSSWMFTTGSFGYLCGSFIGGILYDKLNKVLLLAVSSFGSGVSMLLTPYCSSLAAMLFIKFAGGFFFGGLDTGGNADIIHVWGADVDTYMQALHFAFSIGTLLSPLATEPFLAGTFVTCYEKTNITVENATNEFYPATTNAMTDKSTTDTPVKENVTLDNSSILQICNENLEETNVHHAFLMSSLFMFSATICYIYLYIKTQRNKKKMTTLQAKANSDGDKSDKRNEMPIYFKIIFLSLLSLLISSYCIAEDSFAGFLMTFSLDYLDWDKSTGSYATSVFWFTFCAGRFCGIFIVSCCKNSTLLTTYLCFFTLSYIAFTITTFFKLFPLIWVSIAALGFSLSVIFPAVFSWTSEHIIHVSGKISALFLVSSCLSGMLLPLLIGFLMEYFHPMWYSYVLLITALFCVVCYVSIRAVKRFCLKTQNHPKVAEITVDIEMTLLEK
ncbi:sodium-dependent glucose transporter 1-like isoform X2 [Ruditapes philippinarum]|uniref:sodium-dependent glucose transporter 1-like isoform X2 n=1 Tax=Ruditapes philippinarum TaxID=129788 RepID=UPI00295BBE53|nr:sodium-dependent glucose transporter 1-like isoform X2 [Ruditapes philippinarum]